MSLKNEGLDYKGKNGWDLDRNNEFGVTRE